MFSTKPLPEPLIVGHQGQKLQSKYLFLSIKCICTVSVILFRAHLISNHAQKSNSIVVCHVRMRNALLVNWGWNQSETTLFRSSTTATLCVFGSMNSITSKRDRNRTARVTFNPNHSNLLLKQHPQHLIVHWNWSVVIVMIFSPLAAQTVAKMTTSGAVKEENSVKMTIHISYSVSQGLHNGFNCRWSN